MLPRYICVTARMLGKVHNFKPGLNCAELDLAVRYSDYFTIVKGKDSC